MLERPEPPMAREGGRVARNKSFSERREGLLATGVERSFSADLSGYAAERQSM